MAEDGFPTDPKLQELTRRIQEETDPEKMVALVQQLIARYDEEKQRISPQHNQDPISNPKQSRDSSCR